MRPVAMVVVVAALAALLTAFLAKSWLDRQTQPPQAAVESVTEILVASRDLAAGAVIQADDLRYETWPLTAVTPRLVVRHGSEDAKAGFVGQMARRAVAEGEPVTLQITLRSDAMGALAAMLTPGMRAVSIAITNTSAVSGFVTPGDRVDVVLGTDMQRINEGERQTGGAGIMMRFAAETVLSDVRVLAIDQQVARGRDGAAIQGKTATIEVTPKQAELLTTAGMLGTLQLVLRGQAGPEMVRDGELGFTADAEASKALQVVLGAKAMAKRPRGGGSTVQINRAGQITAQGFQ